MPIPAGVVRAVEQQYGVQFAAAETDAAASALDLYRLLLRKLGLVPGQTIGMSACVFFRLRRAIMARYGTAGERIRPSTCLAEVLPQDDLWPRVQALVEQVGVGFYMPDLPQADEKSADNWAYGITGLFVILPLLSAAVAVGIGGHGVAAAIMLVAMVAIAYPVGRRIHAWRIRKALLKAAHVTPQGTLRQIVASCLGPRGDRLGLYDWRLRWLWEEFTDIVAASTGVHTMLLLANIALPLDQHPRGVEPDQDPEKFAALAYSAPVDVQREYLAQVLAAFMRGEIMSFDAWGPIYTLQWSQHEELHPLAAVLSRLMDQNSSYPIAVSEEDWHYLRRMIAALRSGLPLTGYDFADSDVRHRPPELALEPFWSAVQWQRCEPLLEDLDLPEFDPQVHSSPAAAVALRPPAEGAPARAYRAVMVREDARFASPVPPPE